MQTDAARVSSMKLKHLILACAIALAALGGSCKTANTPPPVVAPQGEAQAAEIANLRETASRQAELAQRAAGAVYGAQDANAQAPASDAREAVDLQLAEAAAALPEPTPAQRAEKAEQNARALRGELDTVRAEMGVAVDEARRLRGELDQTRKAGVELAAAAARERADNAAALAKAVEGYETRLAKAIAEAQAAKDEAANAARSDQVRLANLAGMISSGLSVLCAGAILALGGLAAWRAAAWCGGALATFGILALAFARFLGSAWFWPTAGGILVLIAAAAAFAIYRHVRRERAAGEVSSELDVAWATLKSIVPALDEARAKAGGEVREFLDSEVFKRIEDRMRDAGTAARDYIHDVRKKAE